MYQAKESASSPADGPFRRCVNKGALFVCGKVDLTSPSYVFKGEKDED